MKKIAAMILSMLVVLSCVFAVSVNAEAQSGLDNFLDTSKDLTVAFLGGSITEGAGSSPSSNRYATLITNEFFQKTRTNGAKVTEINGGVGGTGAAFGLQRINKDITYANPDIVFVEFAVNDAGTAEEPLKNYMENIVRQLQKLPKVPEIIFLYTTCLAHENVTRAASYMSQVAKAYNIPEIDLNTFIWEGVEKGEYVWNRDDKENTLTGDNTHPNNKGYRVYADRMIEVMSRDGFFKRNTVLENPLFYTSVTEHPICVDTNAGNGYTSEDRIVRADYKTAAEAGLSSGYTLADAAAKLTADHMLITDGDWADTNTVSDGTYRSNVGKHMDILSVSSTAGSKMYYRFTGTAFGIFGANGPKGGNLVTNIYKANDLTKVYKTATIGRYQNIKYYKPSGNYSFSGLPFDTYIVEMTTAAGSKGGTMYGIGYFLVDDGKPTVKPQALNPALEGDAFTGGKLTASFTYKGNSISAGTHKYEWLSSGSLNGEFSLIATGKEYTVSESDSDKYIKCRITPVNAYDVEGTPVDTEIVKIAAKSMAFISKQGDFEGETTAFENITKSAGGMSGTTAATADGSLKTAAHPVRGGYTYYYSVFVKPETDMTAAIKVNRNSSSVSSEAAEAKAGVWTRITFEDKASADDSSAVAELTLGGKTLVDDFMCVEVKDGDAKSDVLPMVCNLGASYDTENLGEGTTITVNAERYDVNPSADMPSLSYKWQISEDNGFSWTDISDGASYKITADVIGKYLRAAAIAKNTTSEGFEKTDEEYLKIRISKYGDIMYYNDANTKASAESFTTRFPNIAKVSYDEAAGIAGSGAAVVTRTKPTTGSSSNDRSDRLSQRSYNFKAGYTYFMSIWAKKTREDLQTSIGFYLIPANTKPYYTFSGKKGTGTNLTTDLGGGGKWINTSMGDFTTDWTRYSLGYKIEGITLDGEPQSNSGGTTAFTVTMSGSGGTAGDYAADAPISESNPAKFMFDDFFILELPGDDLLYDVLPRVSKAELGGENKGVGSTFTAEGEMYDVNPYAKPVLSYKWQNSADGVSWTDIADGKTYTAKASDSDKYVRAVVTATSVDSFGIAKSHSIETKSEFIKAPDREGSVVISGIQLKIDGESANEFKPGNASVSFNASNNYTETSGVTVVLAVYKSENGVKRLDGFKTAKLNIEAGKSEQAELNITVPENAETKLFAYFTDDLKPIAIPGFEPAKENVVFVGTDDENDVTIYEINKFNPVK